MTDRLNRTTARVSPYTYVGEPTIGSPLGRPEYSADILRGRTRIRICSWLAVQGRPGAHGGQPA